MSESFVSRAGRPATSPRLIAGLLYLQHAFDLSDEEVVWQWVENSYWQVFTGETSLQTEPPIDPSSLTRWRKRLGEAGVEELLAATIEAAKRAGVIKASSVKRVIVDTTVMPKAIAHPTDSRLLERCREHLVRAAKRHGLKLRHNYNREAPRLALQIGRYAHAKQYKRMRHALRTLRSRVGRVMRDVERQVGRASDSGRAALQELIASTKRILSQKPKDKNKFYALHAPEVECLAKGKARTPYEFGVKVSITTTHKEGLVVGARSMPGNPYDGHTLAEALEQAADEKRSFDDARAKRLEISFCRSDDSTSERSPPACRPSTVNSIQRPAPAQSLRHMADDFRYGTGPCAVSSLGRKVSR
jgi:IS5 family transposase